jgi:hypothetical protein
VRYAHAQRLIPERPELASVFLDPAANA